MGSAEFDSDMQAFADRLGRAFPGRAVQLVIDPEGHVSARVDGDHWRIPDDGLGLMVTRYNGDRAHVVRLDDDMKEAGAWTIRIGADPGLN